MVHSSESQVASKFIGFGKLLKGAASLSLFIIIFGSLVRAASAGLACPDWPLCFGQFVPSLDYQIFLEWFHRLLAGILCGVLVFAFYKMVSSKALRQALGVQLGVVLVLLAMQVVLGGLTVLKLLDAKTVAAHLINALLFLTVLIWTSMRSGQIGSLLERTAKATGLQELSLTKRGQIVAEEPGRPLKGLKAPLLGLTIVIFLQLAVGGMVSTNYAGLACPDFPKCHGEWIPPPLFPFWLQVTHRALGVTVFVAALAVLCRARFLLTKILTQPEPLFLPHRGRAILKKIMTFMHLIPVLIAVQIALGVINVLYFLPTSITVLHLGNAVVLYMMSLISTIYVWEPSFSLEWRSEELFSRGQSKDPRHVSSQQIAPANAHTSGYGSEAKDGLSPEFVS